MSQRNRRGQTNAPDSAPRKRALSQEEVVVSVSLETPTRPKKARTSLTRGGSGGLGKQAGDDKSRDVIDVEVDSDAMEDVRALNVFDIRIPADVLDWARDVTDEIEWKGKIKMLSNNLTLLFLTVSNDEVETIYKKIRPPAQIEGNSLNAQKLLGYFNRQINDNAKYLIQMMQKYAKAWMDTPAGKAHQSVVKKFGKARSDLPMPKTIADLIRFENLVGLEWNNIEVIDFYKKVLNTMETAPCPASNQISWIAGEIGESLLEPCSNIALGLILRMVNIISLNPTGAKPMTLTKFLEAERRDLCEFWPEFNRHILDEGCKTQYKKNATLGTPWAEKIIPNNLLKYTDEALSAEPVQKEITIETGTDDDPIQRVKAVESTEADAAMESDYSDQEEDDEIDKAIKLARARAGDCDGNTDFDVESQVTDTTIQKDKEEFEILYTATVNEMKRNGVRVNPFIVVPPRIPSPLPITEQDRRYAQLGVFGRIDSCIVDITTAANNIRAATLQLQMLERKLSNRTIELTKKKKSVKERLDLFREQEAKLMDINRKNKILEQEIKEMEKEETDLDQTLSSGQVVFDATLSPIDKSNMPAGFSDAFGSDGPFGSANGGLGFAASFGGHGPLPNLSTFSSG